MKKEDRRKDEKDQRRSVVDAGRRTEMKGRAEDRKEREIVMCLERGKEGWKDMNQQVERWRR